MQLEPLTYVSPRDPRWKRWTMRAIEDLSGRRRLLPIYHTWRTKVAGKSPRMMGELLDMIGTRLDINADSDSDADMGTWPVRVPPDTPLVIVPTTHLASATGSPCWRLPNSLAVPIAFSQTATL